MSNNKLIWVASRQSDMPDNGLYSGSITFYGNGADGNVSLASKYGIWPDNNNCSDEHYSLIADEMLKASEDSSVSFVMYNPVWAYEVDKLAPLRGRIIGLNDYELIKSLANKIETYRLLSGKVPVLKAKVICGSELSYDKLCTTFKCKGCRFVVQAPVASGGYGTYIMNRRNEKKLLKIFDCKKQFLVSVYEEHNVPVNVHAVIFDDGAVVYPPSMQLLRISKDRLLFRGSDYIAYRGINEAARSSFERSVRTICEELRSRGYRGVCGIDATIVDNEAYINEINTRFQSSTPLLNKALRENDLPTVDMANIAAFSGESVKAYSDAENISVNYCALTFLSGVNSRHTARMLEAAEREPDCIGVDTDGYYPGRRVGRDVYMFRMTFKANIASVSPDGGVFFHENVFEPEDYIFTRVMKQDRLAVKITVMTQGVDITPEAKEYLETHGGIRPGNNNSVDIDAYGMIINAPRDVRFIHLTPFTIKINAQKELELFYYDTFLQTIKLFPLDPLSLKTTKAHGIPYESIAYLSTDRLRVHTTNACVYKLQCKSCKFCNIVPQEGVIPIEDITEVIYDYLENSPAVRHFLIGGQSAEEANVRTRICDVARIIREKTDKNIYVMALPYDRKVIKELCDAGINELACNAEVYDETLAREYMPGKGRLPRQRYIDTLSYATDMLGTTGNVKTAFIIGLEPHESLMAGIRDFTEKKIEIVLSVFRPLPGTPLENLMAPPIRYLYRLYHEAQKISIRNGLRLGPSCVCCQNNTLSLPED